MGQKNAAEKTVCENRKARHDYFIHETYEAGIELFGTFGRLAYAEDEPAYGVTSFEMISGKGVKCFNDRYVQSGMGKNYGRTLVRGAMRCSDTEPKLYHRAGNNELNSPSFVALSQPLSGVGDRAIEVFDFEGNGTSTGANADGSSNTVWTCCWTPCAICLAE